MTELNVSVPQLAAMVDRDYIAQIKLRLRNNEAWVILLDPRLAERTRQMLNRIVGSIDTQKARVREEQELVDPGWLRSVDSLRRHAKRRLDAMAPVEVRPVSSTKETRAWRAFSAKLATALELADPEALDALKTPYGGLTAREWLTKREEKKEMSR